VLGSPYTLIHEGASMRVLGISVLTAAAVSLAACDNGTKQQLATFAHADSVHVDSLGNVQKALLEEVMTSTQFVNEINTELSKARALSEKPPVALATNAEMNDVNEERKRVVARITKLVAQLDAAQARLANVRKQAASLSTKDSTLVAQVAAYEKSIAELQAQAEKERAEAQKTIMEQNAQIASLNGRVDTLTTIRTALVDTVGQLTTEKNTAYYVIGTKDELIKKGILVAEGQKRFLLVGSRNVSPARQLDPTQFTRIDRLSERSIKLPDGQYEILSRQNPSYLAPVTSKDGKLSGEVTINQPEQFWSASKYLIIVRS
jgi:hypothetical protein